MLTALKMKSCSDPLRLPVECPLPPNALVTGTARVLYMLCVPILLLSVHRNAERHWPAHSLALYLRKLVDAGGRVGVLVLSDESCDAPAYFIPWVRG